METVIVGRHAAMIELCKEAYPAATVIPHATIEAIKGKHVVGVLPIQMAAYCSYITVVEMEVPFEKRGTELTCAEMKQLGATFVSYVVMACE